MLRTLIIVFLLSFLSIGSTVKTSGSVYICDSPNAERYHLTDKCRGLNACTHEIRLVTKETATSRGLTLCKWED